MKNVDFKVKVRNGSLSHFLYKESFVCATKFKIFDCKCHCYHGKYII